MEQSRETRFADRARTRIWEELPDSSNPYLARTARCHGYALEDMVGQLDSAQTLFLLLRGELPDAAAARLLQRFLVAFCNPGPRHVATRAVMNAAASGTHSADLPSIGLALLSGAHLGSAEVEQSARFIASHRTTDAATLALRLVESSSPATEEATDRRIAPGFGTLYGDIDPQAASLADLFAASAASDGPLAWAARFCAALQPAGCGWMLPGVAAAVCCELGFGATAAGLLYQYASLPGLLAHGLEMSGQGITAMPFVADENYVSLDTTGVAAS